MNKKLLLPVFAAVLGGCSATPPEQTTETQYIRYIDMENTKGSLNHDLASYSQSAFELTVLASSCHLWKQEVEEKESRMEVHCNNNSVTIFTASDTYKVDYQYVNEDGIYYTRTLNKPVESWSDQKRILGQLDNLDEYIDINTNYVHSLYSAFLKKRTLNDYLRQFERETRLVPEMPTNMEKAKDIFEKTIFNEDWFNSTFARVSLAQSDGLIPDQDELEARILTEVKPLLRYAFDGLSIEYCNPTGINFEACAVTATPLAKHIEFEDSYIKVRAFNQGTVEEASYVIEVESKTDSVIEIKSANILLNNLRFKTKIEDDKLEGFSKGYSRLKHKRGWSPMVTVEDKLAAIFYGIDVKYTVDSMNMELSDHIYFNPLMMLNEQE